MKGKGFWKINFLQRVEEEIPDADPILVSQIETDLAHRLFDSESSGATRLYEKYRDFGYGELWARRLTKFHRNSFNTQKGKLVDEAIRKIKELTKKTKELEEVRIINPLTSKDQKLAIAESRGMELYSQAKSTGPYGKEIIRRNPPSYGPLTKLTVPMASWTTEAEEIKAAEKMYKRASFPKKRFIKAYVVTDIPEIYNSTKHILPNAVEFKSLLVVNDRTKIQWGLFNTIILVNKTKKENGEPDSHAVVMFRHINGPKITYSFYDPLGISLYNPDSSFFPYRDTIKSIIAKDGPIDVNYYRHQCRSPTCSLFSNVRATYPHLSHIQYDKMIFDIAERIVNDPNFPILENIYPTYKHENGEKVFDRYEIYNPDTIRKTMELGIQPQHSKFLGTNKDNEFFYHPDVIATPIIMNKGVQPLTEESSYLQTDF